MKKYGRIISIILVCALLLSAGIICVSAFSAGVSAHEAGTASVFGSLAESFEKTFIREDRWKMFLSGMGVTVLISVLSIFFATVISFLLYLLCTNTAPVVGKIAERIAYMCRRLPMVVGLMILYYIVFSKTTLGGIAVTVTGFSVIYGCNIHQLLKYNVNMVDEGQTEAALTLGYNKNKTFFRIILPQGMKYFLPAYENEIVSMIKETAAVGYIAVQDITKVSDIIRSRTYEAFFPLLASAVIYFLLAMILVFMVRMVMRKIDPANRKPEKILKGIKTK